MIYKILKKFNLGKDLTELLKHSKNYISAEVLTKGLAFITLPIFTRLMSPDEYGVLSVFVSFTGILAIIFGFGIRGAIGRYYYEDTDDFFEYFSSNFWFVLSASIGLTVLVIIFRDEIYKFLNIPYGMIYIALGITIPQVIYQLYQAYLTAAKSSKKVATLNVTYAFVSTVLAIIIMYQMSDERYYAKAIGQAIGVILMFGITLWYLNDHIKFNVEKKHLKYSLVFGLPIVVHLLSQNILNTFDQIIINQLVGSRETGLYSVAYKIGMIQNIISMGILKSWTPIFYEKLNENKISDINDLAKKYALIVSFVAVVLIFFSKEVITILVDKEYHEALIIIPIIVVSYFFFFVYTMYVNYAFYQKKTKKIALFTIIAGGLNIGLNYLLIPEYGYIAAAWTTLASYGILFILHYINVKWVLDIKEITSLKVFVLPIIMILFAWGIQHLLFISNTEYNVGLLIRIVCLIIPAYFLINRIKG
ncbi:lipopolysaccharide biosynthesis protein [Gracilimonas halophila]|uniref:Lipopolysaccharide biosynthesis protein n=1 Tax=Gracilimonas halophila TaxID=1834464 RepID=A0ABW5JKN0_9BACT